MNKYLAILPAYNEGQTVAETVADVNLHAPDFDVLVIDDGSADDTMTAAKSAGALVIRHPFNLGIGGAVQSGYRYALAHDYEVAVQVDADGQHDARHINELLSHLKSRSELGMVTGSRFLVEAEGGYRSSMPRRVGIRLFARILSLIVGQRVTDPTSGFRMCKRHGIELFAREYPADYPEVEAVLLMHAHKLESCELPVKMRSRRAGTSSITSGQSFYYMVKVLLAILVGLFRSRPTKTKTA